MLLFTCLLARPLRFGSGGGIKRNANVRLIPGLESFGEIVANRFGRYEVVGGVEF